MANRLMERTLDGGRVYEQIKARVIACDFECGKPIRLAPLAEQLGVSLTPVREALNMLAAKGLVVKQQGKGFIAPRPSEAQITGLYRLNEILLTAALTEHDPAADSSMVEAAATAICRQLGAGQRHSPDTIAKYTGGLFSSIATLARTNTVVDYVDHVNDRLFHIRTLEYHHMDVVFELTCLGDLLLAARFDELREAITNYHDVRVSRLPQLMDFDRRRAQ